MSWGTDFKTDIFLSHQSFISKYDVELKIKELDELISKLESNMKMFASANPKDIIPNDWNDEPINWLSNEIEDIFELYRESIVNRYNSNLYLDYLNDGGEIKNE